MLRMYDVGGKLLNGIKSVYVNSVAYVRVKRCDSECFRIDSGVRQECIISPWFFNVCMSAVMKDLKIRMGRRGMRCQEEGRGRSSPGLLYADGLVLFGESGEDLRAIVELLLMSVEEV